MTWVAACASDQVKDRSITRRRVNGQAIALTRLGADLAAFSNTCPHFEGPLGAGALVDDEVVCPWHFFRFNVRTGEAACVEKSIMKLQTFPIKEEGGTIFVQMG